MHPHEIIQRIKAIEDEVEHIKNKALTDIQTLLIDLKFDILDSIEEQLNETYREGYSNDTNDERGDDGEVGGGSEITVSGLPVRDQNLGVEKRD